MNELRGYEILHQINKQNEMKQRRNEEEGEEDEEEDSGASDSDDSKDVKELFRSEKKRLVRQKRIISVGKYKKAEPNSSTTWFAAVLGVFFVGCLAGLVYFHSHNSYLQHARLGTTIPIEYITHDQAIPVNIIPSTYTVYINVDMVKGKYKGNSTITFSSMNENTQQIVLHSSVTRNKQVKITEKTQGDNKTTKEIAVHRIQYDLPHEQMVLKLDQPMNANANYTLVITFEKNLTFSSDQGFYLSKYTDGTHKQHISASTRLAPMLARRAFPCVDEERFKSTFHIVIQHDKVGCKAISNMPIQRKVDIGTSRVETHFQTTPRLSTSAIGWFLADMVYKEVMVNKSIPVRVYAAKNRLHETNRVLTLVPFCLKFYQEHLKMNLIQPKLDLMPVSTTFRSKPAWGMILMEEDALLHDDQTEVLQTTETPVCRAIADQILGLGRISQQGSSYWLKGAIASYIETKPFEEFFPSWNIPTENFIMKYSTALTYDSSLNTHPLEVKTTAGIALNIYDTLTYGKGAALLNMLANVLGKENFYNGLQKFLKKYRLRSANESYFWLEFSKIGKFDVEKMMKSWIKEPGYPVLFVERTNNKKELSFRQERFGFQSKNIVNSTGIGASTSTIWQIPINIQYDDQPNISTINMDSKKHTYKVDTTGVSWFKANYGATGYFRVYYSRANWLALLNVLNMDHTVLPTIDRVSLLSDVASFANYKYMRMDDALDFTLYLKNEHQYGPWEMGLGQLNYLRLLFYDTPLKHCFDSYMDMQMTPVIKYIYSKAQPSHSESKLLPILLHAAVSVKKQPLTNQLNLMFLKWLVRSGDFQIPPAIFRATFHAGILSSTQYEWTELFNKYQNSTVDSQKLIIQSLSMSEDLTLLKKLLKLTDDPAMDSSMKQKIVQYVCANPVGRDIGWEIFQKKFTTWFQRGGSNIFWDVANECMGNGKTRQNLTQVLNFIKTQKLEKFKVFQRYPELIRYRVELVKEYTVVQKWFSKQNITCQS